ncbi:transcriptional regulator [Dactylosporangium aurantiacum]|uniref:Transcriptional regulator n=1 Tax=Dactylosporangium aurantiacum TaxID=35754 RepID=A0A9Q9INB9_9ACTN|nr:transcriptional regulator [Dactylosporangium aurantiacum]
MPPKAGPAARRGAVTGYMFKLIRESVPASQERLAAHLGIDRATVQSWESGRRPFTSVGFGQAIAVRHKLIQLGADAQLLSMLDEAAEADYLLELIIDADPATLDVDQHPLGWTVLTHSLTEMLAWAVIGQEPARLQGHYRPAHRRGPSPSAPSLESTEARAFFDNLHVIADRTGQRDSTNMLLHRQACFLASLDLTGRTADWLSSTRRSTFPSTFHGWSPMWPDARSIATSLAKHGDPQPLRDFIARAHPDDACELAGLNYSAYWVGDVRHRQHHDTFMPDPALSWRGGRLLRHLVERLDADHPFVDLNIHSLWALLTARQHLAQDEPHLGTELLRRAAEVLDTDMISPQSRRELTSILYGLRMSGVREPGTGR